ncbi:MAG TPA: hypothetical protein VMS22_12270 [Candidatus Eisenbacteria bacterium]|nr:hypothetical protein [Candidatus Eisenbacteria bacterium]
MTRLVLLVAAALSACAAPDGERYWGQVESHLAELAGAPLVSANWEGRYRPYVFRDGRFVALIPPDGAPPELDLHAPTALSATELLLSGSESGKPWFDVFRWDMPTHTLTNLTATPEIDDGDFCVDPQSRRIAYRAGGRERFAVVAEGTLRELPDAGAPAFTSCVFTDADTLVGVARSNTGAALYRCAVGEPGVRCEQRQALDDTDDVTRLFRIPPDAVGVVARLRDRPFRRPYRLAPTLDAMTPVALPAPARGDVLDSDGTAARYSLHGRYRSSLAPADPATVFAQRCIADACWAVVATPRIPRTLARLEGGRWVPVVHPKIAIPPGIRRPRQVWMRGSSGRAYQAFWFGPRATEKVVVWWHGGPRESVSPRFNPYFARLNQLGFGVLAVNYPGSTGRGRSYEARFDDASLLDCASAVWSHLHARGARYVVSWSVSSGNVAQLVLLRNDFPLSGIVDQAGWGQVALRIEAERRGVPVYTIRGRQDVHARSESEKVDLWYDGGHDVTLPAQWTAVMDGVGRFLGGLATAW